MAVAAAKILSQKAYNVPGKIRITEYFFEVPRDWANSSGGKQQTIKLFARAGRKLETPADPSTEDKSKTLPWLVYLTGGPGFGCGSPELNAFTPTILEKGYQILMLDQRGTGLSTPIAASTLGLRGDEKLQADYLKCFRADSIVKDCEAVRQVLTAGLPKEKQKWSIMGQSYGGFCSITYLSFAPESLRESFIFGGLQALVDDPDEVYKAAVKKVIERNEAYYGKYPEDVARVNRITTFLQRFGDTTVRDTSNEGYMTARRFMQLGLGLGFHGGVDQLHDIVLRADNDLSLFGHITRPTMTKIESHLPFEDAIIYAVLHESIYCSGKASNWSAWRTIQDNKHLFAIPKEGGTKPVYFTGEMIFPWMFDDYFELRKMKEPAEIIAKFKDWPPLFDREQLKKNKVPVYAAVYTEDMYVDFGLSMQTAKAIKGCKTFITSNSYHDGLRTKADDVLKAVFALRDDTID